VESLKKIVNRDRFSIFRDRSIPLKQKLHLVLLKIQFVVLTDSLKKECKAISIFNEDPQAFGSQPKN
jgi:hypothetical protein